MKAQKATKRFSICLPQDVYSRYRAEAMARGLSVGRVMREQLERPAEKPLSLFERMGDFVGCVESGIGDLSTNPVHLEGFGQDVARFPLKKQR